MSNATIDYTPRQEIVAEEQSLGMSKEANEHLKRLLEIIAEFSVPISRQKENAVQKFYDLLSTWKTDTKFYSTVPQFVMHPAYQEIIGMGSVAIPLLLRELKRNPDHWFWALSAITGENPIKPEQRGKMTEMIKAWLDWGQEKGYSV